MKGRFFRYLNTFFNRRAWDPNSISGLGVWEPGTADYSPAVAHTEAPRGAPHPHLPLIQRLEKVQADLDALDKSLPDLHEYRS